MLEGVLVKKLVIYAVMFLALVSVAYALFPTSYTEQTYSVRTVGGTWQECPWYGCWGLTGAAVAGDPGKAQGQGGGTGSQGKGQGQAVGQTSESSSENPGKAKGHDKRTPEANALRREIDADRKARALERKAKNKIKRFWNRAKFSLFTTPLEEETLIEQEQSFAEWGKTAKTSTTITQFNTIVKWSGNSFVANGKEVAVIVDVPTVTPLGACSGGCKLAITAKNINTALSSTTTPNPATFFGPTSGIVFTLTTPFDVNTGQLVEVTGTFSSIPVGATITADSLIQDRQELKKNPPAGDGCGAKTGADKVEICHVPIGNPANAHTICVSVNAEDIHLGHGDTLGPCPAAATSASSASKANANAAFRTSRGKSFSELKHSKGKAKGRQ